jgi:hypothetical protein
MKTAKWMNIMLSISRIVLRPQNEVTQMVAITVLEAFFLYSPLAPVWQC